MAIKTKDLVRGLRTASQVVYQRNSVPILSSLLVSSTADEVTLTGTDMDIRLDVTMPGKVSFDQTVISNPSNLASVLARGGGEETRIKRLLNADGKEDRGPLARLYSGDIDMEMTVMPPEDFPENLKLMHEDWSVDVGTDFLRSVKQVSGAISTEETRYYLNGIYLDTAGEDWSYSLVSTDGHRLYSKAIQIANDNRLKESVIIPRKAVELLLKLFDGKIGDAPIRLSFGRLMKRNDDAKTMPAGGSISVCRISGELDGQKVTITAKLIDGSFPDYRRVIPKDDQLKLRWSYNVGDLRRAMSAFTAYRHKSVTAVKLAMAGELTTITANWVEFGRMRMKVAHQGEVNFEIGFNSRYLFKAIENLANSDRIMLATSDSVSPVIVTGDKDADFRTVLMPMRV